jgi:dihydroorotate dehydrogenase (NAD+) catalytic subunit
VEFFMAGASAVQIGTATLATPDAAIQIVNGLERFMEEQGIKGIEELHIQRT